MYGKSICQGEPDASGGQPMSGWLSCCNVCYAAHQSVGHRNSGARYRARHTALQCAGDGERRRQSVHEGSASVFCRNGDEKRRRDDHVGETHSRAGGTGRRQQRRGGGAAGAADTVRAGYKRRQAGNAGGKAGQRCAVFYPGRYAVGHGQGRGRFAAVAADGGLVRGGEAR